MLVRHSLTSLVDPEVAEAFDASMEALRQRFTGWQGSPYRSFHRPELFQMIFDDAYRREMLANGLPPTPPTRKKVEPLVPYTLEHALEDLFIEETQLRTILAVLRNKQNLILQGAPGVGKSFVAERIAFALVGSRDRERVKTIQFHQSYGYEDFIQGWRPNEGGGFALRNGHFYEFCRRAEADPEHDYVLIIDEINRGNLSRIFGEMMVLLEPDKRGPSFAMPLTYSPDSTFHVPERLHIIGLMNTADRSLAMVDYALRRRFAFVTLDPGFASPSFERTLCGRGATPALVASIRARVHEVNRMIADDTANLGRGYLIGHSFFVPRTKIDDGEAWYRAIIEWEILPLLHEYWVDDPARLDRVRDLLLARLSDA
ncbi:MAG TPA: AAA family ATPase [Chthoniobacteraceae bacterium]|nr:AAA family ATPase [Chthoniobacteraceae bacterium]